MTLDPSLPWLFYNSLRLLPVLVDYSGKEIVGLYTKTLRMGGSEYVFLYAFHSWR